MGVDRRVPANEMDTYRLLLLTLLVLLSTANAGANLADTRRILFVEIHRVPKKGDTKLMAVTLSFLNRFSNFFTDILSGKFAAQ